MKEITKEEIKEISDHIWAECDNGEGLTWPVLYESP